ncbi:HET-domain-containing protein, partial [Cryphonectria parasitica EP155]
MTRDSAFRYPELQHDADSIRILTLEPGRFLDQLVCRLTACTFASKPRYVALSYTWETPYPDNEWLLPDTLGDGVSTNITVNGVPYQIQRNLYMALLYLRSSEHPFNIWVDAVCIDQSNIQERNAQVSLMSFIYKRAQKVVTWLGTRALPEMGGDLFRAMGMDWALGETRHLAASLSSSSDQHQYRDRKDSNNNAWSRKPDSDTMARIAESRYWRRMWVVQELCLPRVLLFVYESRVWSYEDLCQSKVLQARVKERGSLPGGSNTFHHRTDQDDARFEAMSLLLRAREARFKLVTLEDLVDRFGNQECTQI